MIRYTIRRLLAGLVVIFAVTLATYLLFGPVLQWQTKIDAARLNAPPNATPAVIELVRTNLGLDKPWYEQYGIFVKRLVVGPSDEEKARLCRDETQDCGERTGRLGTTYKQQRSVDEVIKAAAPVTLSLTIVTAIIWMLISIPVGILSALRTRSFFDRTAMVGVLLGQSLPIYYFGLLAIYFLAYIPNSNHFIDWFGVRFEIFPLGGYVPFSLSNPWPWLWHLILPAATLALQFAALYVRMIRSNMLTTMSEDYIRTARAKGAGERRVVLRHGLRNALLPVVTMLGMDLGILLGGAILTEYTFGLQGIGKTAVEAATSLDVPLTAGIVLFAAVAIVLASIVIDLLYAVVDPRIRLT